MVLFAGAESAGGTYVRTRKCAQKHGRIAPQTDSDIEQLTYMPRQTKIVDWSLRERARTLASSSQESTRNSRDQSRRQLEVLEKVQAKLTNNDR